VGDEDLEGQHRGGSWILGSRRGRVHTIRRVEGKALKDLAGKRRNLAPSYKSLAGGSCL
jgi:hypothetical protein